MALLSVFLCPCLYALTAAITVIIHKGAKKNQQIRAKYCLQKDLISTQNILLKDTLAMQRSADIGALNRKAGCNKWPVNGRGSREDSVSIKHEDSPTLNSTLHTV